MADLLTLGDVKRHLRLPVGEATPDQDVDLLDKMAAATALVLDYVGQRRSDDESPTWASQVDGWTVSTVPALIKTAILVEVAYLYRYRGDDEASAAPRDDLGFLPQGVIALLHRYRDPALS